MIKIGRILSKIRKNWEDIVVGICIILVALSWICLLFFGAQTMTGNWMRERAIGVEIIELDSV